MKRILVTGLLIAIYAQANATLFHVRWSGTFHGQNGASFLTGTSYFARMLVDTEAPNAWSSGSRNEGNYIRNILGGSIERRWIPPGEAPRMPRVSPLASTASG